MGVVGVALMGVVGMVGGLIAIELVKPARAFEAVKGWRAKCLIFSVVVAVLSSSIPLLLAPVTVDLRLLPGQRLGIAGGTVVAIALSELLVYWVHRLHHRLPLLWRWVHQLHHSAERIDVFGAAYFHPFEIIEGAVVGVVFFSVVLGVAPEAAALAILWQAYSGVFQHGNIATPRWLGYFVQRPEMHAVHHERGVHGSNYANLPIWDILFGTFNNPRSWRGQVGFYSGASKRTVEMLLGRDVSGERGPA